MRLVGTAAVCAALAFGAAFLVGRAVGNGSSQHKSVRLVRDTVYKPASDPQLASEFTPSLTAVTLRRVVKVHHKAKAHRHVNTPSSPSSSSSSSSSTTPPADTSTAPTYTTPTYTPPASTSKSSGSGSGTTSVGGSSKKKKSSGSGVTSVG